MEVGAFIPPGACASRQCFQAGQLGEDGVSISEEMLTLSFFIGAIMSDGILVYSPVTHIDIYYKKQKTPSRRARDGVLVKLIYLVA